MSVRSPVAAHGVLACQTCRRQGRSSLPRSRQAARSARPQSSLHDPSLTGYALPVEAIREREYPHMNHGQIAPSAPSFEHPVSLLTIKVGVYLDHSGATIYARSTVDGFAHNMTANLYGNPHSANEPAKVSGEMVDATRVKALRFLGADPRYFDLVFVANATAGIKFVAESFRDLAEKTRRRSFWYGYHKDAHTSLVGVRQLTRAGDAHCFGSDGEVDEWLADPVEARRYVGQAQTRGLGLFAYPAQSNLSGRRLPLAWTRKLRASAPLQNTYSLLDAAAYAMTSPTANVFADPDAAPDFTCLSFYKIFGFPDLGALVVRRDSGHILTLRKYFGGGTVTMVSALGEAWHKSKGHEATSSPADHVDAAATSPSYSIHDGLEDGTLPFHSILALDQAIDVHGSLYGSMENVSRYTNRLAAHMYARMTALRHGNGRPVCRVYCDDEGAFGDPRRQGATVAFNITRADGSYVAYSDVEKLANDKGIYVRSGGICCPGGLFTALQYEPWELERAKSAGHHCGSDGLSLIHQLPTGVVRASLGAMSTEDDVCSFVSFLREAFVESDEAHAATSMAHDPDSRCEEPHGAMCSFG